MTNWTLHKSALLCLLRMALVNDLVRCRWHRSAAFALALALGFVTFTLLAATCLAARIRLHLAGRRLAALEQQAVELGLGED